jgi:transposase
MSKKRRQYTEEVTQEAVRLVIDHGYGVTEAARNLGINATMLGRWKRQIAQQRRIEIRLHCCASALLAGRGAV